MFHTFSFFKKESKVSDFWSPRDSPPTPYFPTTHSQISPSLFDWPSLLSTIFFFFFNFFFIFTLYKQFSLTLPHSPTATFTSHHFHHLFSAGSLENSIGNGKAHSPLLFKVKISNLLVGLYAFTWGYVYLNLNNNTHVIYEY